MIRTTSFAAALALTLSWTAHAALDEKTLALAQANFKTADANANGQLTPAEFRAFIDLNAAAKIGRAPKIKANNAYDRAFAAVDKNADANVTWAEYLAAQ
jgi:hypothetical protein